MSRYELSENITRKHRDVIVKIVPAKRAEPVDAPDAKHCPAAARLVVCDV